MYNQFTPYGYPQFGQQANGYPQNMYMPNNATAQAPGGMEVVPVSLIQQVEQVQVQPGQRKMVLVQNEPVIASRSADNMGLVTTDITDWKSSSLALLWPLIRAIMSQGRSLTHSWKVSRASKRRALNESFDAGHGHD